MNKKSLMTKEKKGTVIQVIVCLSLFLGFWGCRWKGEAGTVEQEKKVKISEPELIWQRDFGDKIRRFKLHKTIDGTDFPVMAVETENELIVFDKKGNEKIKRQIQEYEFEQKGQKYVYKWSLIISDNGEYVLERSGIPEFSSNLLYTTIDGEPLWGEKNFYGKTAISSQGDVIILLDTKGGEDRKGSIKFYSSSGELLKQHPMDLSGIEKLSYDLAFSEDGNYFVLNVEQWIEDEEGRRAIYPVILFDKKGNLLWQREIEVTQGEPATIQLLISPSGNYISYSSDKYIYTVDKHGNLLWKKEFHNLVSFSEKEDILLMGKYYLSKNEAFWVIDVLSGKKLWSRERGYPKISPDGTLLAIIGSTYEHDEKKLTLHIVNMADKKERLILKRRYLHPSKRRIRFSSDSKHLYLVEQEKETKLSVYKMVL